MAIHFLNCFTCNARVPSDWCTGTLCLLIETDRGPVLVDTGPGLGDYVHKPGILRTFQLVTHVVTVALPSRRNLAGSFTSAMRHHWAWTIMCPSGLSGSCWDPTHRGCVNSERPTHRSG